MRVTGSIVCVLSIAVLCASIQASQHDKQPPQEEKGNSGGRIIITEIMYNPNSPENVGETEWIEIANVGTETVVMKNWRIDDEDKKNWSMFNCTLKPGEIAVLVNSDKVSEKDFRAAWDAPAEEADGEEDGAGGHEGDGDDSPKDEGNARKSGKNSGDDASMARAGGEESRAENRKNGRIGGSKARAGAAQTEPDETKRNYQIIGVKWGGIANSPDETNEIIQLLDGNDKIVCEVNIQEQNGWPSCKKPDGPSIFLTDVTAKDFNDGKLWQRSTIGKNGARANNVTDVFKGKDVGSPGFVEHLTVSSESGGEERRIEKPKKSEDAPGSGGIDY